MSGKYIFFQLYKDLRDTSPKTYRKTVRTWNLGRKYWVNRVISFSTKHNRNEKESFFSEDKIYHLSVAKLTILCFYWKQYKFSLIKRGEKLYLKVYLSYVNIF